MTTNSNVININTVKFIKQKVIQSKDSNIVNYFIIVTY